MSTRKAKAVSVLEQYLNQLSAGFMFLYWTFLNMVTLKPRMHDLEKPTGQKDYWI